MNVERVKLTAMRNVVPTPSKPKTRMSYAQQFPTLPSYVVEPSAETREQKPIEVEEEPQKVQLEPKTEEEENVIEEQKAAERSSEHPTLEGAPKPEEKVRMRSSRHRQKVVLVGGMPTPAPPSKANSRRASSKLSTAQQSILDESGKLLNVLRNEMSKLRNHNAQLRAEYESLKDSNQRLQEANSTAGNQFSTLNQHAQMLNETTVKQAEDLAKCRQQIQQLSIVNVELKEELKMKQATYVAEVQSRLHHQKMLSKVVDKLQGKCRDTRLVEEILLLIDEGESEYLGVATSSSSSSSSNRQENTAASEQKD